MTTDAMGSASWNDFLGDEAFLLGEKRYLVLGRPVTMNPLQTVYGRLHLRQPKHIVSIAQTGSGKGVSLVIPNLLSYKGSAFVIDPKGENAWVTAKWRREGLGQKVYILDPFGEVNKSYGALAGVEESVARFNPLSLLDPDSANYVDVLAYLADALMVVPSKEPFWDETAGELLAGLMAYVTEEEDLAPNVRTLGGVRYLLSHSNDELRKTCGKARDLGPQSPAARKLAQFAPGTSADTLSDTTIAGVFASARTQTKFLDSTILCEHMAASDFNFDELATGHTTVYVVLPADELHNYARWLRLMVSIGIKAVARIRASEDLPVLFVLDEFGTVGNLEVVRAAYGLMRGFGIALWVFVQDVNQLRTDYGEHGWETFIGNSSAVTSFGIMDQSTAEYVSKMLGTKTASYQTSSESRGSSSSVGGNSSSAGTNTSFSTSTNFVGRPLLTADELRTLDSDFCIILGRHNPVLSRRIIYHEDYPFYIAARADPHHSTQAGQTSRGEKKTTAALVEFARQQIRDFESARTPLLLCGLKVEKKYWGTISVSRSGREIAKFRSEASFVPKAQEIVAEGYRRLNLLF